MKSERLPVRGGWIGVWDDGQAGPCMALVKVWCMALVHGWCMGVWWCGDVL